MSKYWPLNLLTCQALRAGPGVVADEADCPVTRYEAEGGEGQQPGRGQADGQEVGAAVCGGELCKKNI